MAKVPFNDSDAQDIIFGALGTNAREVNGDTNDDDDNEGQTGFEDNDDGDEGEGLVNDNDLDEGDEGDDEGGAEFDSNDDGQELDDLSERQPAQEFIRDAKGNIVRRGTKVDRQGNIVDAQGRIIARAGNERRFYNDLNKARYERAQVEARLRNVGGNLQKTVDIAERLLAENTQLKEQVGKSNQQAKALGLDDRQAIEAMTWYKGFQTDAIGSLKRLLTQAAARGIDVTQLGLQPGGIDSKSLLDLVSSSIDEKLKPLTELQQREQQQRQQQERSAEEQRRIAEDTVAFFQENPEAQRYGRVFEAIYKNPKTQNIPLREAWLRIQLQVKNMSGRQNGRGRGQQQQRRGMNNGRRAPSPPARGTMAPINESTDKTLLAVLDELGVQ